MPAASRPRAITMRKDDQEYRAKHVDRSDRLIPRHILSPAAVHALEALPDRHQLFAIAIATLSDVEKAGEVAGLNIQLARKAATIPEVARAAMQVRQDVANELGITAHWVLAKLKQNVEMCMNEQPVLDRFGKPTGVTKFEANAANRALELLGRHLGLFVDQKVEIHTGTLTVRIVRESSNLEKAEPAEIEAPEQLPWANDGQSPGQK